MKDLSRALWWIAGEEAGVEIGMGVIEFRAGGGAWDGMESWARKGNRGCWGSGF